jgi:hypothetical protein
MTKFESVEKVPARFRLFEQEKESGKPSRRITDPLFGRLWVHVNRGYRQFMG